MSAIFYSDQTLSSSTCDSSPLWMSSRLWLLLVSSTYHHIWWFVDMWIYAFISGDDSIWYVFASQIFVFLSQVNLWLYRSWCWWHFYPLPSLGPEAKGIFSHKDDCYDDHDYVPWQISFKKQIWIKFMPKVVAVDTFSSQRHAKSDLRSTDAKIAPKRLKLHPFLI